MTHEFSQFVVTHLVKPTALQCCHFTWNPHKLLTAPQQCSVFLTRHSTILTECHSASATYLFQKDKFYDTKYDSGDKHIQCGRKPDVLKFWFMWKAKVAPKIKERMMKTGSMMITYQPIHDLPNFFRLVLQNSALDHSDMDFFIEEIERLGHDL
uniref:Acidic amino acid decarboxylase GADL1 n=1 Tax=Cacopsylla melanoneura TaxID=428564 RepID=A0A8D8V678_9HEMI